MRTLVEESLEMLAPKAHEKGLEIAYVFPFKVPSWVKGDPGRVRQTLLNLIGNAIKFTEKGDVVVRIILEKRTSKKTVVRFQVKDTGIGIPPDRRNLLFESFSQLDPSTSRKFGGTGLGLAISKQLAEMMGGRIGVESRDGRGSTFWFTACFEKSEKENAAIGVLPAAVRRKRILVVDDNDILREMIGELLVYWEVHHEEASSTATALEMMLRAVESNTPFDMVIIGWRLQEKSAESFARTVKADKDLCGTVIVLMTPVGHREDPENVKKNGFSTCLPSPVRSSQLFYCLTALLSEKAQLPEMAPSESTSFCPAPSGTFQRPVWILLVDDDMINRKYGSSLLVKLGYQVDTADSGKAAIRKLGTESYDIVLMDVQMPLMDGYETTRLIRDRLSDVRNHDIPVIAVTANAMKGDREKCIAAKMDDYITKPIDPEQLARAIFRQLGRTVMETIDTGAKVGTCGADVKTPLLPDRFSGDEVLYRKFLNRFCNEFPSQIREIKEAWERQQCRIGRRDRASDKREIRFV